MTETTEQTAQPTPGPWEHEAPPAWNYHEGIAIFGADGQCLAKVTDNGTRSQEETEANARVLAAALDLLAALEDIVEESIAGGPAIQQYPRSLQVAARAVIRKARGQEVR